MTLIKWRPQSANLMNEMDNIFHSIIGNPLDFTMRNIESRSPYVDIKETDINYTISADIPGFNKSELNLTLNNKILTISGKQVINESNSEKFVYRERRTGSFKRSFNIPKNINLDEISATIENGILLINLPKVKDEIKKLKEIQIN